MIIKMTDSLTGRDVMAKSALGIHGDRDSQHRYSYSTTYCASTTVRSRSTVVSIGVATRTVSLQLEKLRRPLCTPSCCFGRWAWAPVVSRKSTSVAETRWSYQSKWLSFRSSDHVHAWQRICLHVDACNSPPRREPPRSWVVAWRRWHPILPSGAQ